VQSASTIKIPQAGLNDSQRERPVMANVHLLSIVRAAIEAFLDHLANKIWEWQVEQARRRNGARE
jgi:hypothetical protein